MKSGFDLSREEGLTMGQRYLNLLFGQIVNWDGLYICFEVVWKDDETLGKRRKIKRFFFTSLDQAQQNLETVFKLNDEGYCVFVAVNPVTQRQRSKETTKGASLGHVEIDTTETLSAEQILALLKKSDPSPSFFVTSGPGGGAHVYFLLNQLQQDKVLAEELNKALINKFHAKDSVYDVCRCLRLAGTRNNKPEYKSMEPFRALLMEPETGVSTYPFDMLQEQFKISPPQEPQPATEESKQSSSEENVVVAPEWFEPLYSRPNIKRAWQRKGKAISKDPSAADFHLLSEVLKEWAEISDEKLGELLLPFRECHDEDTEKANRPDYIKSTIKAVRDAAHTTSGDLPENWFISMEDFEKEYKDQPESLWLIEGFIEEGGYVILGAPPKNMKSLLAIHAGISVASGKDFLGEYKVGKTGRVLIIAQEDRLEAVMKRLRAAAAGMGLDPQEPLPIDTAAQKGINITNTENQETLRKYIVKYKPALVIMDPLRAIFPGDENDSGAAREVTNVIQELSRIEGTAFLLNHHWKKNQEGPPKNHGARLRGSGDWHAGAESILGITEKKHVGNGRYRLTLSTEHRNAADSDPKQISIDYGDCKIVFGAYNTPEELIIQEIPELMKNVGTEGIMKSHLEKKIKSPLNKQDKLSIIQKMIDEEKLVPVEGQDLSKNGIKYVLKSLPQEPDSPQEEE